MITAQKRNKNPKSGPGSGTARWNRKKDRSNELVALAKRKTRPGYPKKFKFENTLQVREYLDGEEIECLLCGRYMRTLGVHLIRIHETPPDTYRKLYGIPWTYGLACEGNRILNKEKGEKTYREICHKFLTPGVPKGTPRRNCNQKQPKYTLDDYLKMLALMEEEKQTLKEVSQNHPGMPHVASFHLFARKNPKTRLKEKYRKTVGRLPPDVQVKSNVPITWCVSFLKEIKRLKKKGWSNREIAEQMGMKTRTVERHFRGYY